MRIIKEGNLSKNKLYENLEIEKTCKNCGTIFAYTSNDLHYFVDQTVFNNQVTRSYIECPICKSRIYIENGN
jgi:Zn finger protein HypA/HybF involved in hydrogenase expression